MLVLPAAKYIWDANGLRKSPSPFVANKLTSLWRLWHNIYLSHYQAVDDAHERFDWHVRIAPNHISILDPRAPNKVYGHGANLMKEGFYDVGPGVHRNLADTRDKPEHQAKRKVLAHTFVAKTVVGFEPVLVNALSAFMTQSDRQAAAGCIMTPPFENQ